MHTQVNKSKINDKWLAIINVMQLLHQLKCKKLKLIKFILERIKIQAKNEISYLKMPPKNDKVIIVLVMEFF